MDASSTQRNGKTENREPIFFCSVHDPGEDAILSIMFFSLEEGEGGGGGGSDDKRGLEMFTGGISILKQVREVIRQLYASHGARITAV